MENSGILNRSGWSIVRKAQVIGVLAAVLLTVALPMIPSVYGLGPHSFLLVLLASLVIRPAAEICHLFGWEWRIDINHGPSVKQMILAILTNALLLFIVGTLIGWITARSKTLRKN
jgi:hypothetical protein